MKLSKCLLGGFVALSCVAIVQAEVKLAPLFTDGMVLQRDMPVPVWGKADPGEQVTVIFGKQSKDVKAGTDGKWLVKLDSLKASSDPAEMIVKGSNEIVLKNVLVGEVWVCSGQSNMEMGIGNVKDAEKEIADADKPQIRLFLVPKKTEAKPCEAIDSKWVVCSPDTIKKDGWSGFSAAGYFFGREINSNLDVPVGLIGTYWGGTPAQAWTPIDVLEADSDFAHYVEQFKKDPEISNGFLAKFGRSVNDVMKEMQSRVSDSGNNGETEGWQKPGIELSSWETVKIPDGWFTDKTVYGSVWVNIYGSVWFRRDIEIPAAWAGKDIVLHLGVVDDFDTTYFNGEKIGAIGKETANWWTVKRDYKVPGRLVKAGANTVAVRIFNDYMDGGFKSGAKDMSISLADGSADDLKLAGDWSRRIENAQKTFPLIPKSRCYPSSLYNGMIAPVIPFAIRGAIWYQGESNAGQAYEYRKLFPSMIKAWRDKWGQGDFPFYFVQLANFRDVNAQPVESSWAELREAQSLTLGNTFNTNMAVTIDIGEAKDIHPKNKQDVGLRLALCALAGTYGKDVDFSGPVCVSMKIENGAIRLFFDYVGDGLEAKGGEPLTGFSICGADRKFVWANAKIEGDTVLVSSPEVKAPVAVRYAWSDNPVCNLVNDAGLPASPFRTDSFQGITQSKK
jgi:sialate O-acetylesterase